MGTDELFRKRQRGVAQLRRGNKEKRKPYEKVLIVCEGEKTEPYYLRALRGYLKLAQAKIEIDSSSKSSPTSVVKHAKKLIKESSGDPYDHVFCVMDRDRHADFDKAMDEIKKYKNRETTLRSIVSNPCFEFWILLHFEYTTKIFGANGDSPCNELIKKNLKAHIGDYEKDNGAKMLSIISSGLEGAVVNAKKANEVAKSNNVDNPTTQMDELVDYLRGLRQ